MFEKFSQPIIIGHRGACAHAPENTISSFELAVDHQADFVELDAKLSKDGQVMVIHDQTVDRTTDGYGKVNELLCSELKALDAGSKFDPKYRGERIPTLNEVFEQVGKKLFINVELTNYSSPKDDLIEKVFQLIVKQNMQDRVLFSSFLPANLTKMKRLLPHTPVALLCLPGLPGIFSRSGMMKHISPAIIHPYLSDVNQAYVKREHGRDRRVHVWTVNADSDIKRMITLNVDGIFTDDPLKARQVMINSL